MCIGVTLECRRMESEVIGDGWGHVGKVYHDKEIMGHAWPLIRTCGWTVPTFRVTWFLSPS